MQLIDYHILFATLVKRQALLAQCGMNYDLASLESRHLTQMIDYQRLFASFQKIMSFIKIKYITVQIMWNLFGEQTDEIINELNEALAA